MEPICFIHAADLHLDAAFRGISREAPPDLVRRLHEAAFVALNRLFELCEEERPAFLVLAGDVYNQEDQSLRAQLAVHDGCRRLQALGIRVFIAHGNHDPLASRLKTLRWPGNVTIFGEEPEAHPVLRNGETVAVVHGVSHASARETRNLAARFRRAAESDFAAPCFQVGVLHTSLGEADGETRYAPCGAEDLEASGLDYWALGHVHERRTVLQRPLAVYPGCLQGLHVHEQGEKGCLVVTARAEDGEFVFSPSFRALGPVIWRVLDIGMQRADGGTFPDVTAEDPAPRDGGIEDEGTEDGGIETLDGLEERLRRVLDETAAGLWPGCEALVARLRLSGRTPLDAALRRPGTLSDLVDRLREGSGNGPLIWVKDVELRTRPLLDREQIRRRDDLLGEILRLADECRAEPEMLQRVCGAALKGLFEHARARKALEPLSDSERERLLEEAERLCVDLLEND